VKKGVREEGDDRGERGGWGVDRGEGGKGVAGEREKRREGRGGEVEEVR